MKKIIIFLQVLVFLPYLFLYSHGVETELINGGLGIKVLYDDLSPISFAEAKVFSPDEKKVPFQEGFTDKNGIFIFVPDKIGTWKIVINDGLGHGVVKNLEVKDLKNLKKENSKPYSRWYKVLIGLAFIFGITGIMFFIVAKKQLKGVNKDAYS